MSKIKMIGLDLDGTTLNEESRLSERTKEAFRRAEEKGVHIVIATGRTYESLPEEITSFKSLKYLVTSNGARIINREDGHIIYENLISKEATQEIHDLLKPYNPNIEFFSGGRAYIGREEYEKVKAGLIRKTAREYVIRTRTPLEDVYQELLSFAGRIENINVNVVNMKEKAFYGEILKTLKGVTVTSSFPLNYEIGGSTTSKADALKYILDLENLTCENLMACGDNPNDIAMIRFANIGVAMGNAEEEVKKAADIIAPPNYEDGVAFVIEKYALEV